MGVYSNQEILTDIESGNIYIDPFNEKHLNTTSYDVTLGEWFYKSGNGTEETPRLYNPYDEADVQEHFGEVMRAEPLSEHTKVMRTLGITAIKNVPSDHPVMILRPHERILAHTHEFIGILNGTTSMQARSTTGRNGIVVCMDAGWGDAGYADRWTMEIKNMNEQYVVLPVGIRIAQIVFHKTGPITGEYSELSGKYQQTRFHDHEATKANWDPSKAMKPKAYKDVIEPLQPVEGTSY
jgi:dCTP deaminase